VHGKLPLRPQPEADRVDAETTRHGEIIVLVDTLAAARRKPSAAPRANVKLLGDDRAWDDAEHVQGARAPEAKRSAGVQRGGQLSKWTSAPEREDATRARSGAVVVRLRVAEQVDQAKVQVSVDRCRPPELPPSDVRASPN
jgi:hypothetical protein